MLGFYFCQINISGNFRHAHVGKSVHVLIFGHFPDDADDGGDDAPPIFPSGQSPSPIAGRDEISRSGIPHFDKQVYTHIGQALQTRIHTNIGNSKQKYTNSHPKGIEVRDFI